MNTQEVPRTDDELLSTAEVARIFLVDTSTVRRWIKDGAMPGVVLPSSGQRSLFRVKRSTVDAILRGRR